MKKDLFRKGLVVTVIVLFIGISTMPLAGSLSIEHVSTDNQIRKSSRGDDTTPPVTTISFDPATPDGDNGWYVSDIEITLEATDDMSGVDFIKYLLDDNDWFTYTDPFKVKSNGYHGITYYAVDKAGNVEQPSEVVRSKIDQTYPQIEEFIEEAYKEGGKWYVTFTVKCSDAMSGMDRVEFYVNDELMITDNEEPYEWTIEWSDDFKSLFILVFDNAGNSVYDDSPDSVSYWSVNELIDNLESSQQNVGPSLLPATGSLSIEKHVSAEKRLADCSMVGDPGLSLVTIMVVGETGGDNWYGSDNNFAISYESDEIASIYYGIDSGEWVEYSEPFDVSDSGEHILEWYAVDYEGNQSEVDGPFDFKIDQTKPAIQEVGWEAFKKEGDWWVRFTCYAVDEMSGMDRVEMFIDQTEYEIVYGPGPAYEFEIKWSSVFEKLIFWFYHYDKVGNMDVDDVSWWYESPSSMPIGGIVYNLASYPAQSSLKSSMFSTDITDMVEDDNHQSSQSNVPMTEIVDREKPRSGCSLIDGFELSSLIVIVDREMGNNDWVVSDVSITFIPDSDDITAVYYKLDDGDWMLYTIPLVISDDGEHKFSWYIVDSNGNLSTPDSISFKIDQTSPSIELTMEEISKFRTKFTANVSDETSGINRVEFHAEAGFFFFGSFIQKYYWKFTDYEEPYEWAITYLIIIDGRKVVRGSATVYDNAGHNAIDKVTTQQSHSQQSSFMPSSQESELQNNDLNSLLSPYGLDTEDTTGEFEQLLYNLVSKRRWRNPSLAAELRSDIDELSDILDQIGVTDDMTIAEALPIIEDNKEQLQEKGINLFCSIHMDALVGGFCWPPFRLFKALCGHWKTGYHSGVRIKGLIGLQYIDCNFCKERYSGVFIGMMGFIPPLILHNAIYDRWCICGDFTLFSHSDVPFVNSTGGSQQTKCPCNQQGNLQNNNMQSSSQQSLQTGQQSSKEQTFSLQDTDLLEETINDIITRFQDAETQEERIAILKEIPIVLDKYGLLPEDISVEEMQELIVSSYLETLSSDSFQSDQQLKVARDSPLMVSKSVFPSSLAQYQVSGSNRIVNNNIKLNTGFPLPAGYVYLCFVFGRISNLREHGHWYIFNCINVIGMMNNFRFHHFTNGEKLWICGYYSGILTNHFVFAILDSCR